MPESDWRARHREIEKIHRRITARLDASDQRDVDREKRRAALKPEAGWQERIDAVLGSSQATLDRVQRNTPSPAEMQARVKRVVETVDKFFDVLESRLQNKRADEAMAEGELQRKVDRLEEVSVVQAGIMDRLERKYDEAIRRHDQEMAELRAAQRKTEESLQVMTSGVRALTETVDQFIKGSKSNGHKPGGKKK